MVTLRLLAIFCCFLGFVNQVQAQSNDEWSSALDSARAKEDAKQDSIYDIGYDEKGHFYCSDRYFTSKLSIL